MYGGPSFSASILAVAINYYLYIGRSSVLDLEFDCSRGGSLPPTFLSLLRPEPHSPPAMGSTLFEVLAQQLLFFTCAALFHSTQVVAQSSDPGAASGVQPGDIGAGPAGSTTAAGDGADTGSVNLSMGATVAIAVVVSVVVVLGSK